MKNKYINKKTIIAASILSVLSFGASANVSGDINVGVAKTDMLYDGSSLSLDSEAVSIGLNLNLMDYYKVGFTYSDMAKESDRYEFSLGYLKPINERVSLAFGGSYLVYEGAFLSGGDDKIESLNIRLGTEIKLNRDVTFDLGLERYDADYTFDSELEDKDIAIEFYAGLTYDFDDRISVSLYRREMLQETGLKVFWRF